MQEIYEQILYYLDALWRRRWTAFVLAVLVAMGGWYAVAANMPNRYEANSKIYVDVTSVMQPLLRGIAIGEDLGQQAQLMRRTLLTRPNLEEVARRTDMDLDAETDDDMQKIISGLQSSVRISADRENIFSISYTSGDAEQAYDVVRTLTTLFVESNVGEKREDLVGAQQFIGAQITRYERELEEAESRLAQFEQENMETLSGQGSFQDRLAEARGRAAQLRGNLADARARLDLLRRELNETPEMLVQQGSGGGPPSNVEVKYMEQRAQVDSLLSRYTEQHPDVVLAKRRLDRLREELNAVRNGPGGPQTAEEGGEQAAPDGVGSEGAGPESAGPEGSGMVGVDRDEADALGSDQIRIPNPTYGQLRMELVRTQSDIQQYRDQLARAESVVENLESKAHRVPEIQAERKKLNRDYNVIREKYESLLSRQETAQVSQERQERGSSMVFRIIEPPEVPSSPAGPNRPLFLGAALIVGLGAGVGSTFLLSLAKTTYGSINHLQRDFDMRVIGSVSALPGKNERMLKLLDRIAFAACIVLLFAVLAVLIYLDGKVGLPRLVSGEVGPGEVSRMVTAALPLPRG